MLFILPNLFTCSSIFCGFLAVLICSSQPKGDDFFRAAMLIVFAMFFDTIDGRVARLTKTQSAFGVQLDSLADLVSFGVAPGALLYGWSLHTLGLLGLMGCFAYVAAGAIRLARFNVMTTTDDGTPKKPSAYIAGLPIPGAAGILVSLVCANHAIGGQLPGVPFVVLGVVLGLALLMVSTIQFRSFKDLRLTPRSVAFVSLAAISTVAIAVVFHAAVALVWLLGSYVAIAIGESVFRLVRRRPKAAESPATVELDQR